MRAICRMHNASSPRVFRHVQAVTSRFATETPGITKYSHNWKAHAIQHANVAQGNRFPMRNNASLLP